MTPAAEWADEALRRQHNARVEVDRVARRLTRAERSVALLRAALTVERERAREAEAVLRSLLGLAGHAERIVAGMSGPFVAMHAREALRALGMVEALPDCADVMEDQL